MCRKSTIPHPNRQKNKLQTKNATASTNRHVADQGNSHPEKKKTPTTKKQPDLMLYKGRGLCESNRVYYVCFQKNVEFA
jgi:hypothetical protein